MKLSIQPLLPIGNYLNKRYGIEMDFPDDSNPKDNFKYLDDVVTSIHMAEFPMFYKDGKPLFLPNATTVYKGEEPEMQVKEPPKTLVEQISSCTELKVLESYRLIAKTSPECQKAYDNKLKELQK